LAITLQLDDLECAIREIKDNVNGDEEPSSAVVFSLYHEHLKTSALGEKDEAWRLSAAVEANTYALAEELVHGERTPEMYRKFALLVGKIGRTEEVWPGVGLGGGCAARQLTVSDWQAKLKRGDQAEVNITAS
jgi:hypothetical protein